MKRTSKLNTISIEGIEQHIYLIRGQKVMLAHVLASFYRVPTFRLNEQVKRNMKRFPDDFMFKLTREEEDVLISQNAMSNKGRGGRRVTPYAFTEQGVAMLSSVLNSEQAVEVNIAIMRAFVRVRSILAAHKELARKLEVLERNTKANFTEVFRFINAYLISKKHLPSAIGYHLPRKKH